MIMAIWLKLEREVIKIFNSRGTNLTNWTYVYIITYRLWNWNKKLHAVGIDRNHYSRCTVMINAIFAKKSYLKDVWSLANYPFSVKLSLSHFSGLIFWVKIIGTFKNSNKQLLLEGLRHVGNIDWILGCLHNLGVQTIMIEKSESSRYIPSRTLLSVTWPANKIWH